MRFFQGLSMTAAAAALLVGGAAARADEMPGAPGDGAVVGIGVICNTSEQAAQFVALREAGSEVKPAVELVNQKAHEAKACGVAAIAFVPDKTVDTRALGGKLVRIMRVNVVAGYNGSGWQQIANTVQYAIVEADGLEI